MGAGPYDVTFTVSVSPISAPPPLGRVMLVNRFEPIRTDSHPGAQEVEVKSIASTKNRCPGAVLYVCVFQPMFFPSAWLPFPPAGPIFFEWALFSENGATDRCHLRL